MCPTLEELDRYVRGDRPSGADPDLAAHVSSCASCRDLLVEVRENLGIADHLASIILDPGAETIVSPLARGAALGEEPAPPVPPGYRRTGDILRGGQGLVFRAVQISTGRDVAIKVLREGRFADVQERARFEREIRILGQLQHANIVTIHGSGEVAGRAYFVTDYVDGPALDRYILGQPAPTPPAHAASSAPLPASPPALPLRDALELMAKVADAVHAAHLRGVIHRDLKPSNIRVNAAGQPMILDFGLAKLEVDPDAEGERGITRSGQFIGSLPWSSPELVGGIADRADVRSDVYALGVVAYQVLTGRFPYDVSGPWRAVFERIERQEPARPSRVNRRLNAEIDSILLKCLQKDPARRYQSTGDLARDLRRYLSGHAIEARADSTWYVVRKSIRRHRVVVAFSAALFVLLVAGLATITDLLLQERDARRTAVRSQHTTARVKELLTGIFLGVDRRANPGPPLTLREVVDRGADRLRTQLNEEPEVRAELLETLSRVYRSLGAYEPALELAEESVELRRALSPAADEALATCLENLAVAQKELEHYADAMRTFEESLAIRRAVHGDEDARVAESMASIGMILARQKDFTAAEAQYRSALRIHEDMGDAHSLERAYLLNELANVLSERHQYAEARSLIEEALADMHTHLGPKHPRIANALNSLGGVLDGLGDFKGAEQALRESIQMRKELVGEDDPILAYSLSMLATTLAGQGRYPEAIELARDVLRRRIALIGEEKQLTAVDMSNLAGFLARNGELQEAEALTRRALEIQRKLLPPGHAALANRLNILAGILQDQDRHTEAEPLYQEALEIRVANFGENSLEVARVLNNLGTLKQATGDYASALTSLSRCVQLRRELLPAEHPDLGKALMNLADAQSAIGDEESARASFDEAVAILRKNLPADHPDLALALCRQARTLRNLEDLQPAETSAREALRIYTGRASESGIPAAQLILAEILTDQGRFEEGQALAQDALQRRRRLAPEGDRQVAEALRRLGCLLCGTSCLQEAEPMLREACELDEALKIRADDWAASRAALGECLLLMGRAEEAEPLLRGAHAVLQQALGPEHPQSRRAARLLSQMQDKAAQPVQAAGPP